MKAMEQNFPVVLSVMQCQVFLTFESEDEILIYLRQSIENKVFTTVFASTTALHLRSKCELHNCLLQLSHTLKMAFQRQILHIK